MFADGARRVALALALLVVVALGPFVQEYSAQPAPRYAMTAAIVDHGTVVLDRYDHALDYDRAEFEGHTYSDKAPGQPVLAVPFYALARAVGAEPATRLRLHENLGLWWVTLWSAILPLAVLAALMFLAAGAVQRSASLAAAVSITFGTLLVALATHLYGHVLAATLGFAAWYVTRHERPTTTRLLAGGLLAGTSIAVEYPMGIVAVVLGVGLLLRVRRRAWWMAVGAAPPLLATVAYQLLVFDHPFRAPITTKDAVSGGLAGIGLPKPGNVVELLVSRRGFVPMMPIVLIALVGGLLAVWRRRGAAADPTVRRWLVTALVVFGLFFLIPAGWPNPWGGEAPGPRYLAPALPFLVLPLAASWHRWPILSRGCAVIGTFVMTLPVLVDHLVAVGDYPLGAYRTRLAAGELVPTLWTMALGDAGWAIHAVTVVVAIGVLVRARRDQLADGEPDADRTPDPTAVA